MIWDDEIDVAEETFNDPTGPATASPKASINSVPLPRRQRSQSSDDFPPPTLRRMSTDASGAPRPVPFAAKFQRIHPGTTGVTVLEHLERLDAVEASLQRLGGDESTGEDTEEMDVGESISRRLAKNPANAEASSSNQPMSPPFSPPGSPRSPLPTVREVPSPASSIIEEDLVALSKSTSHVEGKPPHHNRWPSQVGRHMDWLQGPDSASKKTVIVEVRYSTGRYPS